MTDEHEKKGRGRPRAASAESHEAIIDAVYELLHEKTVRDLTIEEIARHAGVGKPTIYKWWPSKMALVIDTFQERVFQDPFDPAPEGAEAMIRVSVSRLIGLLDGFFGEISSQIIAEGQSDPDVLGEYAKRYKNQRRAFSMELIQRAQDSGEFKAGIDPGTVVDLIYGPIYYRFLFKHVPLTQEFGKELVDAVMAMVKA